MTLQEAKRIAAAVMGEEVYTPEGMVRKFFNNVFCVESPDHEFEVFGDDRVLGRSTSPMGAWVKSLDNIPKEVLSSFILHKAPAYFRRKGGSG